MFLCKNVEIVHEFEMLGCLGWFGSTEKSKKKILTRSLTANIVLENCFLFQVEIEKS